MNKFEIMEVMAMTSEKELIDALAERQLEQNDDADFDEFAFMDYQSSSCSDEYEDDVDYAMQVAESLLAEAFALQQEELKHLTEDEINAIYMADDCEYEDDLPW